MPIFSLCRSNGRIVTATIAAALLSLAASTWADEPAYTPQPTGYKIAEGKFQPSYESLKQYRCPEWFRDAKLGMWAHWGPQAVPMAGDWYARNMYLQDQGQYKDHLAHYGHPSEKGYKDIIPLWKAEKWDPDRLMGLYQKAGARYFVSMGCHHDNFDLWNSQYHRWNAVNMGPHRDVVGDWQKAARKQGLRFGVSEHLGASFTWFQPSHGADKTGDKAGVLYDGANKQFEELYHWPAAADDREWYSKDPRWHQEWFNRIKDLVDHYQPDLLYTDGGVPFGNDVGRSLIAHLYNADAQRHNGQVEAIYTCKQKSQGMWIEDLERGVMAGVRPDPWQTDTSIGDWYYNKNWKYRGADWVIHMLVDIVAKNGNLLINVVQRPDGSLDPEVEQILAQMADWIAINGPAIYGTRPWLVHGEGSVRAKGGQFGEDFAYSARDLRFTTQGDKTLYCFALGWPEDRKITVRSLAQFPDVTGKVQNVELLGDAGKLEYTHNADGLTVQLPAKSPCKYAIALKITVDDLHAFKPELAVPSAPTLSADAAGNFSLGAENADLHGDQIKTENQGGQPNVGFWDNPADWVSWKLRVEKPGTFKVTVSVATLHQDAKFVVEAAGKKLEGQAPTTGAWDKFADVDLGTVEFTQPGAQVITVRARDAQSWKAINLRQVKLTPAAAAPKP